MTFTPVISIVAALALGACGKPSGTVTQTTSTTTSTTERSATTNGTTAPTATPPAAGTRSDTMPPPSTTAKDTTARDTSDPTGGYFIAGEVPKEFAEIEHLGLATIDENAKPSPLNGFIRPKRRSAADYKLVNPTIDGMNLTFTTVTVAGVSYSFTGQFTRLGNFPANPPASDEVVLKGTLTRMKGGKSVELPVEFTYSAGG